MRRGSRWAGDCARARMHTVVCSAAVLQQQLRGSIQSLQQLFVAVLARPVARQHVLDALNDAAQTQLVVNGKTAKFCHLNDRQNVSGGKLHSLS